MYIHMPPKPTCKVVKREGQRGARIDPKGCTVRTEKSADGSMTTRNKADETKIKVKTTKNRFTLAIAGSTQQGIANGWSNRSEASKAGYKSTRHILYDTGAQVTLMSKALNAVSGFGRPLCENRLTTARPWFLFVAVFLRSEDSFM